MEGESKLHKRDYHATSISENFITQRFRKRRMRTPLVIKLLLGIALISFWWLAINLYVVNNASLPVSSRTKDVDPKHMDSEEVDYDGDLVEHLKDIHKTVSKKPSALWDQDGHVIDDGDYGEYENPEEDDDDEQEHAEGEKEAGEKKEEKNKDGHKGHKGHKHHKDKQEKSKEEAKAANEDKQNKVKDDPGVEDPEKVVKDQKIVPLDSPLAKKDELGGDSLEQLVRDKKISSIAAPNGKNNEDAIREKEERLKEHERLVEAESHKNKKEDKNVKEELHEKLNQLHERSRDRGNIDDADAGRQGERIARPDHLDPKEEKVNADIPKLPRGPVSNDEKGKAREKSRLDRVEKKEIRGERMAQEVAEHSDDEQVFVPEQKRQHAKQVNKKETDQGQDRIDRGDKMVQLGDGRMGHGQDDMVLPDVDNGVVRDDIQDNRQDDRQDNRQDDRQDNRVNQRFDDREGDGEKMVRRRDEEVMIQGRNDQIPPEQDDRVIHGRVDRMDQVVNDRRDQRVMYGQVDRVVKLVGNKIVGHQDERQPEGRREQRDEEAAERKVIEDREALEQGDKIIALQRPEEILTEEDEDDFKMMEEEVGIDEGQDSDIIDDEVKNEFDQYETAFMNEEQQRVVQGRQDRKKELIEMFRNFISDKEEQLNEGKAAEEPKVDRKEPVLEKIRNMDERTLPYDPNGPGEMGKGLKEMPWETEAIRKQWKKAEFNVYFSDKISLERSLTDPRNDMCRQKYYNYSLMPKTSIIICFTDESWSPLLRTLHSIINRSPPELIEEILLVDDFSQADHLKKPLADYVSQFHQVKLLRLPSRHGLIRARLAAVEVAKGSVLTFLDSHIEANVGWLEPLLDRVRENRTTVVTPVIDAIDAQSFEYLYAGVRLRGGLTWVALQFRWKNTPESVMQERKDATEGIPSPTMAGGLFSISKQYFLELGTYDPGLEIWGAENIELSLKIWMCGGRIEILPCSHVGHIFRSKQPYKFPSGNSMHTFVRNSLRVVNVWLDDYKDVFYAVNPQMAEIDFGDVTDRLRLREQLQCHNFDWYVKNVYTDLVIPPSDSVAAGALVNKKFKMCLDKNGDKDFLKMYSCHGNGGLQAFRLTRDGVLAVAEVCIVESTLKSAKYVIMEGSCKSRNVIHWRHTKGGFLTNKKTHLCLGVAVDKKLAMMPCYERHPHLLWTFDKYFDNSVDL